MSSHTLNFSIITPSYKQLDHLARCAASVAAQTVDARVEHIIQDGGTGAEFDRWAAGQSFAKCYQQPDGGMYDAINRGFAKASGDVLAWLNCDEQYVPGALAKVADHFARHPQTDILFGDIIVCDAELNPVCYRQAILPSRSHIRRCFLPTFSAATFVRRKVIDDGHLLNTRFRAIADAVWIHGLLGSGYRPDTLPEPLSLFVRTGENLGQTPASLREAREWRGLGSSRARIEARFFGAIHHVRKLLAGAYVGRRVDFAYISGNPPVERRFTGTLGGKWPGQPS